MLGYLVRVYAVATQGRNGGWGQWVTSYTVTYSRDATGNNWHEYKVDDKVKVMECLLVFWKYAIMTKHS